MIRRAHAASSSTAGDRDRASSQTKENEPSPLEKADRELAAKLAGIAEPRPATAARKGHGAAIPGRKPSRNEEYKAWKQTRESAKYALPRVNPNVGKEDDDEFDPSLLDVPNVCGLLDLLDVPSTQESNLSQSSLISSTSSTSLKNGPIARLQRALAARNSDVEALHSRLAKQTSRAERAELEAESRRRDADEARARTTELAALYDEAENELSGQSDAVAELQLQLARVKKEARTAGRRVLELEADMEEEYGRCNAVVNALTSLFWDTLGDDTDASGIIKDKSYEEILQLAQTRAIEFKIRQQQANAEHKDLEAQVASVRAYLHSINPDDVQASSTSSLVDSVRHAIEERNAIITRIRDETNALTTELANARARTFEDKSAAASLNQQNEELTEALTTLEMDLATAEERGNELETVVQRQEELQTLLMSQDLDVLNLRGELERVAARAAELETALASALDENEMLASAAKIGLLHEDSGVGLMNGDGMFNGQDNDDYGDDETPPSPCARSPGSAKEVLRMRSSSPM
ncbi:hypothetical protein HDU87_006184 [Geranomyces variabilis]|uniref:Uncharacterized protein n=1 Tax=Geranomyces variabilis TaxID=109894 RepID=A0AAD5TLF9_9FUNG|nr:hypothetical protein HDU87_006184 [Geranomyces variabilis]